MEAYRIGKRGLRVDGKDWGLRVWGWGFEKGRLVVEQSWTIDSYDFRGMRVIDFGPVTLELGKARPVTVGERGTW